MIVGPDGTRFGVVSDGEAYHPIPSYEFYWKHNRNVWFFIGSTQNFEQSPSYPSLDAINNGANWAAQVKQYWENATLPKPNLGVDVPNFDENVVGKDVFNINGQRLGSFAGLALSGNGQTIYGIVNTGQGFVPVPQTFFYYKTNRNDWFFTGTQKKFNEAPSYTSMAALSIGGNNWDAEIQSYWKDDTLQ